MRAGTRRRRLARLEAARGCGAEVARLRAEVDLLAAACEAEGDDRRFCALHLRLLGAAARLHEPAPEWRPTARPEDLTEAQAEEYLAAFVAAMLDPATRRGRLRARFHDVASEADVTAWLALHQAGSRDRATPR